MRWHRRAREREFERRLDRIMICLEEEQGLDVLDLFCEAYAPLSLLWRLTLEEGYATGRLVESLTADGWDELPESLVQSDEILDLLEAATGLAFRDDD